jgi:hypothetical protein
MKYVVVIKQNDDFAKLYCESWEEAMSVKISFVNYGKCQSVEIQTEND